MVLQLRTAPPYPRKQEEQQQQQHQPQHRHKQQQQQQPLFSKNILLFAVLIVLVCCYGSLFSYLPNTPRDGSSRGSSNTVHAHTQTAKFAILHLPGTNISKRIEGRNVNHLADDNNADTETGDTERGLFHNGQKVRSFQGDYLFAMKKIKRLLLY
jgi:hypothetical protein